MEKVRGEKVRGEKVHSGSGRGRAAPVAVGSNLVVVRGVLRADPERRRVATGDEVVHLDLVVPIAAGPVESVPVIWPATETASARLRAGAEVVVVGRVRRRFFRVGGTTATRTEVHADAVVPVRAAVTIRRVLDDALAGIGRTGDR